MGEPAVRQGKKSSPVLTFGGINENNIEQLRLLNDVTFPIKYTNKFYTSILSTPPEFTKYAYSNGFVVGAICCRLEPWEGGKQRLYIMTLGVLAVYRGHGIGTTLLQSVLDAVSKYDDVAEIYLHVQTSNAEAINFYSKHGFVTKEKIPNYYKRIDPPDCYVLSKTLEKTEANPTEATSS